MSSAPTDADSLSPRCVRRLGRYALYDEIASGGMASVHFGRLVGPAGFARSVAIKRLHPQFAKDPEFVAMFLDEARLAARVRHPNVVPTIDVVAADGELFLVMEYVQGESLARLLRASVRKQERVPWRIAVTVGIQTLSGLHAAHEAKSERGAPLGIIHRDVSPQNILVGDDGAVRIVDFGVAKAAWRYQSTRDGQLKGKFAYMAPEQLTGAPVQDRRLDVYAAAVVLWETLTGRRYLTEDHPATMLAKMLDRVPEPPSSLVEGMPTAIDAIVLRGLAREPADRYATANEMAVALEQVAPMASAREIGEWVARTAGEALERRARTLSEIESVSLVDAVPPPAPPQALAGAAPPAVDESQLPTQIEPSEAKTVFRPPLEPGSVSSASVQLPVTVTTKRRRRTWALFSGAGAVASVLGLTVWAMSARRETMPAEASSSAVAMPAAAGDPSEAPAPPADTMVAAAPTSPPPAVAPAPKPASAVAFPRPTAAGTTAPRRPATRPECNPPYTVDSDGVRIPKPNCLHP
ncbi:MAG TPA: serine/threonine-protein kinase [Polyangiaceae bacterium]|nr:serine/threonine-protein kinase [Polyangiaceae bacterium]